MKQTWLQEQEIAHIHGWDFSHIAGRCIESPLPWDYVSVVRQYVIPDMKLLDYDTGGGEVLLSIGHPLHNVSATEGYEPNVKLCQQKLIPMGIDFRPCDDPANIPFADETFDVVINRHGSYCVKELYRILKPGGVFITQQVGEDNDRDLVAKVLPNVQKPYPGHNLKCQSQEFVDAGFDILVGEETFQPMTFLDVGAFVWFARVIPWEFPEFSVEKCYDKLLEMQKEINTEGKVEGTVHRFLIVAKKRQ